MTKEVENSNKRTTNDGKYLEKTATFMEYGQHIIYGSTGIAFLFIGIVIFGYSIVAFFQEFNHDHLHAFYILINDLMLLLIIMEVMETIINHLRYHTILLEPFLYMGIIAAVRKILGAGAKIVLVEDISDSIFNRYIWDLSVNAAVILIISVALFIFSKVKVQSEMK